jgi:uncharacterized protein (TIGR02145 family)
MRKLLTLLAICTVAHVAVAQTTMNIYQSNGSVLQIPINTIDSITYTISGGGSGILSNPGAGVSFDGYTYSSVVLGNGQEWMAENLRTTTYANGDPIPNVTDDVQWSGLTTGAWAHYNHNSQYENPYGKLYNWFTVNDPRNACPTGWHVPTDADWNLLIGYLDPLYIPNATGEQSAVAGGLLKSTGTIQSGNGLWQDPNVDASNSIGFAGLPAGIRHDYAAFSSIGTFCYWWSSTSFDSNSAWFRALSVQSGIAYRNNHSMKAGFSVRCLRD